MTDSEAELRREIETLISGFGMAATFHGINEDNPKPADPTDKIMAAIARHYKTVGSMTDVPFQTEIQHLLDGVWHSRRVDEVLPEIMAAIAEHDKTVEQVAQLDPFDFVKPCEENCTKERHAYHQGQWDMAERMLATLQTNQPGEEHYD